MAKILKILKIKTPKFKQYIAGILPEIYNRGGLAKGLKEVSSKIKNAKLLILVKNIPDTDYKKKIDAITAKYEGLIYMLPELDSIANILSKPRFRCGIAAIYHMSKKILTQFSGYEHLEWNTKLKQ